MRATERYERAWNAFQIHLNHNLFYLSLYCANKKA